MTVSAPDGRVWEVTGREWHAALRWRHREREARGNGIVAGVAELCPDCGRPIELAAGFPSRIKEGCECGTLPTDPTGWDQVALHGLIVLEWSWQTGDFTGDGTRDD